MKRAYTVAYTIHIDVFFKAPLTNKITLPSNLQNSVTTYVQLLYSYLYWALVSGLHKSYQNPWVLKLLIKWLGPIGPLYLWMQNPQIWRADRMLDRSLKLFLGETMELNSDR